MKSTRTISNPGDNMIYSVPVTCNGDTYTVQSSVSMYQSTVEAFLWALRDGFKPRPQRRHWWQLNRVKKHAPELQEAMLIHSEQKAYASRAWAEREAEKLKEGDNQNV